MTDETTPWARRGEDASWLVDLWVQPGAASTAVSGTHAGRLKVRVAVPAVDGRANTALERYLASRLGVRPRDVRVVSGARSRTKTVRVEDPGGVDPGRLAQ
ncbi:MAG: DUF167 domain-containing protein [Acidimicrobiia bacterium]